MARIEAPREIDQLAQAWEDRVEAVLTALVGAHRGPGLARRWACRMPTSYRAGVAPESAARDVVALDRLDEDGDRIVVATKHEPPAAPENGRGGPGMSRVVFARGGPRVELARAMPILTDLGLHVVEERSARLHGEDEVWIQDFGVLGPDGLPLDLDAVGRRVEACIDAVWAGAAESDSLNRLVVLTSMGHARLEPLRAYRRYRQRLGSRFTEGYQNDVIVQHAAITEQLVRLFELRFGSPDPGDGTRAAVAAPTDGPGAPRDPAAEMALRSEILAALDDVSSLDHDRILRNQLATIEATYRTNAYRPGRRALALKLRSAEVPAMPQPTPLWETFVHGLTVEGVHLRGGMIARGGLRWSERRDYRTEVLGLMRAQMVKNAVIVPTGAKGGFLLRGAEGLEGAGLRDAVRAGYVEFVTALLDVADDLQDGEVVHPDGVRILDDDDTYLVVAADKGTATFSDTANEIALRRGYWLGDAFASGGSVGYDHKALGITARGAWESVKRHFSELGMDPESDPITVVGIGDMSGDVFGNGMLLSRSMRLIAAYDHRHVFVDPDPQDPEASWTERRRLFDGVRTSWDDYDRALISEGGGVFPRTMKAVPLTDEMRSALGTDAGELSPAELVQAVLRAPVDLFWNGGIGTVVKASHERDEDAEDRASDAIRVDARDLRCTVVAEGGNLGFTRAARVEYAREGGDINADFIDNSAGVDCSDHEVNLKILLGLAIRRGDLDPAERAGLLADVTDDVVAHVLADSAAQARVLTQEERRAPWRTQAVEELMHALEEEGRLQRADHGMPTDEELAERRSDGEGLTRPEIAVLVALAKESTARSMLEDDAWRDAAPDVALDADVAAAFPPSVVARFGDLVAEHPLRRHLAATIAANEVVNTLGPTFVARRAAEFGATPTAVVRAFRIAVGASGAREQWDRIDALTDVRPSAVWGLRAEVDEQVRVTSRWFLANASGAPVGPTVERHRAGVEAIRARLAERDEDGDRRRRLTSFVEAGVPEDLAALVTGDAALAMAPHVVAAAERTGRPVVDVGAATLHLGERLSLGLLHRAVGSLAIPDRMTRWAVQALRDDLLDARVRVVQRALSRAYDLGAGEDPIMAIDAFLDDQDAGVVRLRRFLRELSAGGEGRSASSAACSLAVRQLQAMGR